MTLSIRLNNDFSSILNNLNKSHISMFLSMEKLSSGLRINRAADGPAQLIISEQLRSRIASLGQEIENKELQIARYNTGSSAVMELRGNLTELRTLAVEGANSGFNDEAAQAAINTAAQRLVENYNSTIESAEFNGSNLLDGSENSLASLLALEGIDLSTPQAAADSIARLDSVVSEVDAAMMDIGSTQRYDLEIGVQSLRMTHQNLTAAESVIRDVDYASEFSSYLGEMIKMKMSIALIAHATINSQNVVDLLKG